MRKRWIEGEEYWLHGGAWVPRRHLYDYGEEPIYIGPPRRKRTRRAPGMMDLVALATCGPVYGFVIAKLLGH
jgi:hypothetical protein